MCTIPKSTKFWSSPLKISELCGFKVFSPAPGGFLLPTHTVGWVGEPDYVTPNRLLKLSENVLLSPKRLVPLLSVPLSPAVSPSTPWLPAQCSVRHNENHMTDGLSEMI